MESLMLLLLMFLANSGFFAQKIVDTRKVEARRISIKQPQTAPPSSVTPATLSGTTPTAGAKLP